VPAVACSALAAAARPSILSHSSTRALDRWLLVLLAAAALQLAPLPRPLIPVLSPAALTVERAFALVPPEGARPLTIDARDSAAAVLLLSGLFLLFATATPPWRR
jgi:hypothetical protein